MPTKRSTLSVKAVPLDQLEHWPGNPRRHNLAVICESLSSYGQLKPLVVQTSTNRVLTGNGTLDAAAELGWPTLDVHYEDVDDEKARRIVAIDNRSADLASYDTEQLVAMLTELGDLEGTGFTMDDFDDIVAELGAMPEATEAEFQGGYVANEERAEPKQPIAKSGMKEVIITLRTEEHRYFDQRVAELSEAYGTETVTGTILECLKRAEAVSAPPTIVQEPRKRSPRQVGAGKRPAKT